MSTKEILATQLSKAGHPFEMLLLFDMDVRLIDCYIPPMWLDMQMRRAEYRKALNRYTEDVVQAEELFTKDNKVWEECDVVIAEDPFLANIEVLKRKWPNKLYCCFRTEHGDVMQWEKYFDVQLNHALGYGTKHSKLETILTLDYVKQHYQVNNYQDDKTLYYPYPRDPKKIREAFDCNSKSDINFDYRTITFLSTGDDNAFYKDEYFDKVKHISKELNLNCIKVSDKVKQPFMVTYPMESDSLEYYENLASSKYYISISNRLGQGLIDAASCNAITIGHTSSPNHRLICHPKCLLDIPLEEVNEQIIIDLLNEIDMSIDLQNEILEYQNKQLIKYFVEYPKNTIKYLLKLKRGEKV